MTTRTKERLQTLEYILSDGLAYDWFWVRDYDEEAVTATILAVDPDDEDNRIVHKIGPDDIARGLRLYREWLEGKIEGHPGEWKYAAEDEVRAGHIEKVEDFDPIKYRERTKVRESYAWQTVIFDRTNGEDGDYDANTADNVLQFAIYGQVIFG